jgi:hypothetical protein
MSGSKLIELDKRKKVLFFLLILSYPLLANGEEGQMHSEIDHLISYIGESSCTFIRNGQEYSPEEAVEHILNKYRYFGDGIKTTEEFISSCATRSSLTKQPYKISCSGQETVESRNWLILELKRFRSQKEQN